MAARALATAAAMSVSQNVVPGTNLVETSALPLRTQGRHIIDRHGRRVQFACVNWYGAQQEQMVMNGLDAQPLAVIASTIVRLGFNCVRLPFSLELVLKRRRHVPRANVTLQANPELQTLSPLEVFDATVAGLTHAGLMVVLNQHVSSAGWCCSNSDGEGLWYTTAYPEEDWLRGLGLMAGRYSHDALVVGVDLRNEVRPFLSLIPSWGDGNPATDWARAATMGAERVLAENPQALIVISGIQFGMRLSEVPQHPVHATNPKLRDRTVFTTHFYYGWSFDLMAHDMLNRNRWMVMFLASWLCALLAIDSLLLPSQPEPSSRSTRGPPAQEPAGVKSPPPELWEGPRWRQAVDSCCGCTSRIGSGQPLEFSLFFGLLALLCIFLCYGEHLGQTCGHVHILSPPAFVVFSSVCLKLLYILSARILLAYSLVLLLCPQRDLEEGKEGPELELADQPEAAATARKGLLLHSHPRSGGWQLLGARGGRSSDLCRSGDLSEHGLSPWPGCLAVMLQGLLTLFGHCASRSLTDPLRARKRPVVLSLLCFLALLTLLRNWCGSYRAFSGELHACWGGVLGGASTPEAPVWLSEFGTDDNGLYWAYLLRYMKEHELDFAYWSINGEKRYNESETYGLLEDDDITVRHEWKLRSLQSLLIRPAQ